MNQPTIRVLALLEMLQAQGCLSGPDIARRLQVDTCTVRDDINRLLEMGIPVESVRGRYGGYRLLPGYKLPPMMFNEGEALALMLGLKAAERLGLNVAASAAAGAQAKLERVLPIAVREKVERTLNVLTIAGTRPYEPPQSAVLLLFTTAAQQQQRVRVRYRSWRKEETERDIAPYGVVNYQGRWFVAGYCFLRSEIRVFRLDRVVSAELQPTFFTRPSDFDSLACVIHSLATTPGTWQVEVWMDTDLQAVQQRISPAMATLEASNNGVLLRCWVQQLEWFAHFLAGLNWHCIIERPTELREEMHRLAMRALTIARASSQNNDLS